MNKIDSIIKNIENGVKEIYTSDKYLKYLNTVSKFHQYSLNNTLLINMQCPNASLVASYTTWKNHFKRHVKSHEKGIKIIIPYIKKKTQLDENGETKEEETIIGYRIGNVFDYSQTEGEELPTLSSQLNEEVENYEKLIDAIIKVSNVKIKFEQMEENLDGYFNKKNKIIHIRNNMGQSQTINALLHELTHAYLYETQIFYQEKEQTFTEEMLCEFVGHYGGEIEKLVQEYIIATQH